MDFIYLKKKRLYKQFDTFLYKDVKKFVLVHRFFSLLKVLEIFRGLILSPIL